MFQSFTGSSRRPRQVNLSGRTNNPFAAFPGNSPNRPPQHAPNAQSAVAFAQQERIQRQRNRDREFAVLAIQRVWRGAKSRKATYRTWRSEWDANEREMIDAMDVNSGYDSESEALSLPSRRPIPYTTADQCLSQLKLLVPFIKVERKDDVLRLVYFVDAFEQTFQSLPTIATEGSWTSLLRKLALAVLGVLKHYPGPSVPPSVIEPLLHGAVFLTGLIPKQMAIIGDTYYDAMASLTLTPSKEGYPKADPERIKEGVLALLSPITSETISAYESFATFFLTTPDLAAHLKKLEGLAGHINYRMLALAVSSRLNSASSKKPPNTFDSVQARTWLLSYLIFFHRYALGEQANSRAPELEFVTVISELLTLTASHLIQGLDTVEPDDMDSPPTNLKPLHSFIKEQVTGLVNQNNVTGLLSPIRSTNLTDPRSRDGDDSDVSKEARVLATYALNLLRIFPRRGDDIRMWLYLGSAPAGDQVSGQPNAKVPAIKYFWEASRSSYIFKTISSDSTKVLPLLQARQSGDESVNDVTQSQRDQEWTTILLFLELYTFVLKVMDDDEFFSSTSSFTSSEDSKTSWTRESALPLDDVKEMTVFLKNLGFTLYWNAVGLSPELQPSAVRLSSYFNNTATGQMPQPAPPSSTNELESGNQTTYLQGVTGIPLDYFKGLVTGLLRMLHERE